MPVNRLIDAAAWMDLTRRVHRNPGRNRRLAALAAEAGLSPSEYVVAVNEGTRALLGSLRVGLITEAERLRALRGEVPRAGRPEETDPSLSRERADFESRLFRESHRVTYALLFAEPSRVPRMLTGCYGRRLVELDSGRVLPDATVVLGDSLTESEGLFDDRGPCTLRRPGELLYDFTFDPLVHLADGDPFGFGDASYFEVQIHRALTPEDLGADWPLEG